MTEDHSTPEDAPRPEGEPRFSFTDKRKVDPTDGSVRPSGPAPAADGQQSAAPQPTGDQPAAAGQTGDPLDAEAAELFAAAQKERTAQGDQGQTGEGQSGPDPRVAQLEAQVADLTEELKRSQAEYVNSRRRIEATAAANVESAVARVLTSLIGVLDDIELGRQHGDIAEGTPFHSITQKLEDALRGQGLERFGAVGEDFDPTRHEALMHETADDAETTTLAVVMQPGYLLSGRVLRPARVGTRGPQ
ncbi:nucleotide exchange factor GrpE [Brachybacterium sp. EF45031]|uniref:nucleotide exchange factor GrpE n=1 Tax=Brachybacterium sillae TaxID=2810536 RepID=UPI00217ECF57|nr:nucleotide exchange factor GrpE [Brachybacterium sillae]MCS6712533.1 nucleotide exchange factor GrpE [Brachybacterium sillae]